MHSDICSYSCSSFLTDQELRNVIDKLAQFVARNGPEFEKMTMEKQKENPKFSFLFGGDFYGYYKYKLTLEQQQCELGRRVATEFAVDNINYILYSPSFNWTVRRPIIFLKMWHSSYMQSKRLDIVDLILYLLCVLISKTSWNFFLHSEV